MKKKTEIMRTKKQKPRSLFKPRRLKKLSLKDGDILVLKARDSEWNYDLCKEINDMLKRCRKADTKIGIMILRQGDSIDKIEGYRLVKDDNEVCRDNGDLSKCVELIRKMYKRGEVVMHEGRKVIFCGFGSNLTASLFFENGNIWNMPLDEISKYRGDIKKDDFAKQLKLKFCGIRNYRANFNVFL